MRVIGSNDTTLIVSMSLFEFQEVTRARSDRSHPEDRARAFVGREFDVEQRWKRLVAFEDNRQQLQPIIDQLRAMATLLEPIASACKDLTDEPKHDQAETAK
jgi:hypothetical protein